MDDSGIPSFAELSADPEIAALLNFTPVPRSHAKANGWTADLQRMFIAWLAHYGSPTNACDELGKARSGIDKIYKSPDAEQFRESWEGAVALAEKRRIDQLANRRGGAGAMRAPKMSRGTRTAVPPEDLDIDGNVRLPGQVMNEQGAWEDEASYLQRADDARDRIGNRLIRIRRLFLAEISASPGKRAAFEILTGLPIDWDIAARGDPQPDEPWRTSNQREPDMILTAESGWSFGDIGYGPNRMEQAREAIDAHRAEEGLGPIDWSAEDKSTDGEAGAST